MRGKGKYQEHLYKLTTIQIIQVLLERPYTYDELRSMTRIQGTTLSKNLKSLVKKDVIIYHKLLANMKKSTNNKNKNNNIKIGSYYYILNLNNAETKRYIAQSTHYYLEEQVLDSKDSKIYSDDMVNKIHKLASDVDIYYYCSQQMIEETGKEIEKDFNRKIIKLTEEDNKRAASNIEYQKCIKAIKDSVKEHRFYIQEQIRILKPILLERLQYFLDTGASKYDFLIFLSCQTYDTRPNGNRVLFLIYWKIVNDYTYTCI